jgi:hypothetical protein
MIGFPERRQLLLAAFFIFQNALWRVYKIRSAAARGAAATGLQPVIFDECQRPDNLGVAAPEDGRAPESI